ncbi:MAG TPA: M48 family metallopeptidase [Gemmatimonadota bacterium]
MTARRDLYAAQARNRRLTALIIAVFIVLLGAVGMAADVFVFGTWTPGEAGFPGVSLLASLVASAQSGAAWLWGDRAVLNSLHARPLDPGVGAEERELDNVVAEMALAAGIPKPRVYVVEDPAPNAFATGRDPARAAIGVTRGLLLHLDREETQGVVAHEMAHIRNLDTRTMTIVAAMAGTLVLVADWSARALRMGAGRGRGRRRGGGAGPLALVAIVFIVLAPLLSRLLAMAVSRQREYLADASGVELTRNPSGLARALERIRGAHSPLARATRGSAHLFISDPLERKLDDRESFLAELLSTHPPLARRIARIREMGYLGPAPAGAGPTGDPFAARAAPPEAVA